MLPFISRRCRDRRLNNLDVSATNIHFFNDCTAHKHVPNSLGTQLCHNIERFSKSGTSTRLYLSACSEDSEGASLLYSGSSAGSDHRRGVDRSGISPRCGNRVTCGLRTWRTDTRACPGSAGPTHIWWRNQGSCSSLVESFCAWLQTGTGTLSSIIAALFDFGLCFNHCSLDPDLWLIRCPVSQNRDLLWDSSCRRSEKNHSPVRKANCKRMSTETKGLRLKCYELC